MDAAARRGNWGRGIFQGNSNKLLSLSMKVLYV